MTPPGFMLKKMLLFVKVSLIKHHGVSFHGTVENMNVRCLGLSALRQQICTVLLDTSSTQVFEANCINDVQK